MDAVTEAEIDPTLGVVDSADRSRRRQVTFLEKESWHECMAELAADIDPSARRANILVSGIALRETRGRVLCIGDTRLLIGGEVKPCERMEEALVGLQEALRPAWRGGAFAQVQVGGRIKVGDAVTWSEMDIR